MRARRNAEAIACINGSCRHFSVHSEGGRRVLSHLVPFGSQREDLVVRGQLFVGEGQRNCRASKVNVLRHPFSGIAVLSTGREVYTRRKRTSSHRDTSAHYTPQLQA